MVSKSDLPGRWPPCWPDIVDHSVRAALASVPRHLFVPAEYRDDAYLDIPLPIGSGQTVSQPYIVALMTQALRLTPASRVLEIGTGSGYQAAVLSELAGRVWSVESLPELAEEARARLQRLGYDVAVHAGDGWWGWPEHAPYDSIIVTAAAPAVPPPLVQQLAVAGRMVIPVGSKSDQVLWLLEKDAEHRLRRRRLAEVRFVPWIGSVPDTYQEGALVEIQRELQALFRRRRK